MRFLKSKWWLAALAAVILVVILVMVLTGGSDSDSAVVTVANQDIAERVSVIGTVVPAEAVTLAFESSGRVASIGARVGDRVAAGTALVSLESGSLAAQLQAAQADVALQRARTGNTQVNLAEIQREQDALVASALRTLRSQGLVAVPHSATYEASAPLITGSYDGPEGTYKIRILRRGVSNDYDLLTFDLERSGPVEILDNQPTPLGTHGLFITFPDELVSYDDTTWYLDIPNTRSSSYVANNNAYREALQTRDRVIAEAQASVSRPSEGASVAEAELARAQAEVVRIQREIASRTLRAPIAGVITEQEAKLGELVVSGSPLVSIMSDGVFEIEARVPEVDIAKVSVGDQGLATLDAYGSTEVFPVRVTRIDPAETIVDDIATYTVVLQFEKLDDRIRSGMTANVVVDTGLAAQAVAVPIGAIGYDNGRTFVLVVNEDGSEEERTVTTGLVGSDGLIEIVSGLRVGEMVRTRIASD